MTDKTPSSQECGVCAGWLGQWNDHNIHAKNCTLIADMEAAQHETAKKIKHLKSLLEETPTVKEVGERLIKEHKPLFDALAEEGDAKKCTCNRCPRGCHGECCPVHGDGAKKDCTCAVNTNGEGKDFRGKKIICPAHPQDSLDEIKKCLGEYAEKYYLAAEENDPSPDLDYYVTKVQDWHITQVREFIESRVKVLPRVSRLDVGVSNEAFNQAAQVLNDRIDRALERLEDKA